MLPRLFTSNVLQGNRQYICISRTISTPHSADEIRTLRNKFGAYEFGCGMHSVGETQDVLGVRTVTGFAIAIACAIGFFCHGSLRAYPQSGYLPPPPPVYAPPRSYSPSPFQPSNVEYNPYVYAGNEGTNGQSAATLYNPLIPGVVNTAPEQPAPHGMPPPIGSGPMPLPVTPGMGGTPLMPPSNAFGEASSTNATTQLIPPPAKPNETVLYGSNPTASSLGIPLVIPPTSALDTTTVTGVVSPFLQPSPSTPGVAPGIIYSKQYTNGNYTTTGLYYPSASIGTVGPYGGIVGVPAPTVKWCGAQAQTTHDYGRLGALRQVTNGKPRSEYYNQDFGQPMPLTLQTTNPLAAATLTQLQDGPRTTQYLNWMPADSTTAQAAATTPSDYASGVVTRTPNLYSPSTSNTTWDLFGHRKVFMYNQNGYNVPHSPTAAGTPVYAQQTTAYY